MNVDFLVNSYMVHPYNSMYYAYLLFKLAILKLYNIIKKIKNNFTIKLTFKIKKIIGQGIDVI